MTTGQDAVGKGVGIAVDGLNAVHSMTGSGVEVVVIQLRTVDDSLPAGTQLAGNGIHGAAIHFKQAGNGAVAGTVILKGVVINVVGIFITGKSLNAGNSHIVHVVEQIVAVGVPALTVGLVDYKAVREGCVSSCKVAALFGRAVVNNVGVLEGIQPELLLILRLAGEGVELICPQVNVIGNVADIGDCQTVGAVPCRAILRCGFYAAEDADGIGSSRINCLSLVDPLGDNGQGIGGFIQLSGCQLEILVDHGHFGNVHIQIGIELCRDLNFCQHADTLGKLQQEAPCGGIFQIAAGEHIGQVGKLVRNLNGFHIQTEGVGNIKAAVGVDCLIKIAVFGGGIGDLTVPCQLTVAGGDIVEVEDGFIGAVHTNLGDGKNLALRQKEDNAHIRRADAAGFITGKYIAFKSTCVFLFGKQDVFHIIKGDRVTVIGHHEGNLGGSAVNHVDGIVDKGNGIRLHHVQNLAADNRAVHHQVNLHIAITAGGEDVTVHEAEFLIGNLPISIFRNLSRVAGDADAGGSQGQAGVVGQVVVVRGDGGIAELVGDHSRGNHHQRGADASLITVGRTVDNAQLVSAFSLGNKGRGAAAVQIDGGNTAGIDHDLSDFFQSAAAGEGLLTAVENHQNHFALSGDTNTGTGSSVIVVISGLGSHVLTVLDNEGGTANGFLHPVSIACPLGGSADDSAAVIQNGKEVLRTDTVIGDAFHDQRAGGLTGTHVKEVSIDTQHRTVVFHIQVRLGRIGVAVLRCQHLIHDAGHCPALGGIVGIVVCMDGNILAANVHRRNIVSNLLIISGIGIVHRLADTGSNGGSGGGEYGVVAVIRQRLILFAAGLAVVAALIILGAFQSAICQFKEVIGEGIAASHLQIVILFGDAVLGIQHLHTDVGAVCIVDSLADILLSQHTAEAMVQEVNRPIVISQSRGVVVLHSGAQNPAFLDGTHQIVSIQVAVDIQRTEAADTVLVHAQIILTDVGNHSVHTGILTGAALLGVVQQVTQVTCPTAKVGIVGIVVSHIHGTKHMIKLHSLTVGGGEGGQVSQTCHSGTVEDVLLCHVFHEARVFRTCHGLPGAGGVLGYTGTDIIEYQLFGILAGITGSVSGRILLQNLQIGKEGAVVGHAGLIRGNCRHQQTDDHNHGQQCCQNPMEHTCFHVSSASLYLRYSINTLISSCIAYSLLWVSSGRSSNRDISSERM